MSSFLTTLSSFFTKLISIFSSLLVSIGVISGSGPIHPLVKNYASQEIVMNVQPVDKIRQLEGACSDGAYIFQIMIDPSSTTGTEKAIIVKIDPNTWKIVATSDQMAELNHANDITYDSRINLLMISNNYPNYTQVSAVRPGSLTYYAGMTIEHPLYSLAFIKINGESNYYSGISGTYDFGIYDGAFDTIKTFNGQNNGCTRQSIETDGENIYCLYSDMNCIYKYNKEGDYIGRCYLQDPASDGKSYEAEGIFFHNGNMYVSYNILGTGNGGVICKITSISFQ